MIHGSRLITPKTRSLRYRIRGSLRGLTSRRDGSMGGYQLKQLTFARLGETLNSFNERLWQLRLSTIASIKVSRTLPSVL